MSVERRLIVGDAQNEQVAVVTIAVPAGGEVEIDRTWRFEGWEIVYEYSPPRDFGEQIVRRENWPPVSLWQQLGLPAWRRAISRVRNGR